MAEVAAASGAEDLGPFHAQAVIGRLVHVPVVAGRGETRPAAARVVLVPRGKERRAAPRAVIRPGLEMIRLLAGMRRFRALLPQDTISLGAELFAPFRVGLHAEPLLGKRVM